MGDAWSDHLVGEQVALMEGLYQVLQELMGILLPPVGEVLADHLQLLVNLHRFHHISVDSFSESGGHQADGAGEMSWGCRYRGQLDSCHSPPMLHWLS